MRTHLKSLFAWMLIPAAIMILGIVSILIFGCTTHVTYVAAPMPPCQPPLAKHEIETSCKVDAATGQLVGCPTYDSWTREYIKWRNGTFGKNVCKVADNPESK